MSNRCRARFPVPVILYKGKYICRSATISGGYEIFGRLGIDYLVNGQDTTNVSNSTANNTRQSSFEEPEVFEAQESPTTPVAEDPPSQTQTQQQQPPNADKNAARSLEFIDRVRNSDIRLLKALNIGVIADFMVEKKKVKFYLNVTSSEKVDKENRYGDFKLVSLPYPGCEFFTKFRDNKYSGNGLIFDWEQAYVDAPVVVPDEFTTKLNIDWEDYKNWDLVQITQNYLKLLLRLLQDNSSGLLIHCISGWDRTPLFVSLLR